MAHSSLNRGNADGSRIEAWDDIALRLGVGELCAAYADSIDDDRLEEWPDFFADDCRYLITDRTATRPGCATG